MTANAASSAATSRPDLRVDLAAAGLLPSLPSAFLAGRDLDLLAPLRFLPPGQTPSGPALPGARRELAEARGELRAVDAVPARLRQLAGREPGERREQIVVSPFEKRHRQRGQQPLRHEIDRQELISPPPSLRATTISRSLSASYGAPAKLPYTPRTRKPAHWRPITTSSAR